MKKLLFAVLAIGTLTALPNSSQAGPSSVAPGFTNSILEREAKEAPRQEDRAKERQQDRRQDRREDRFDGRL